MHADAAAVFYRPEQSIEFDSWSPGPRKPALVVADWQQAFGARIGLLSFEPVAVEDWCRVHDAGYVRAVWELRADNGFGTRSAALNESLRYTSGSFVAAALHAWSTGRSAASPTAGFHHANHAHGGGYCTFNGLCLAADELLRRGARRVGVLDCDQHFGDGTEDILRATGMRGVAHWTVHDGDGAREADFLRAFRAALDERFGDCEALLYQAGADCHVDDPLGGWMSTGGMLERDRTVFAFCRERGVPVCWNLAGGYQQPVERVLALHRNTMRAFLDSGLCAPA